MTDPTTIKARCPACVEVAVPVEVGRLEVGPTGATFVWLCCCAEVRRVPVLHGPKVQQLLAAGVVAVTVTPPLPAHVDRQVLAFRRKLTDERAVRAFMVCARKEMGL